MNRILIENDTIRSRNLILESRNLDVIMSGKRFLKNIPENISKKISEKISEKSTENILQANVDKDLNNRIKLADSMNIENKENLLNNISQNDDFENGTIDELYDSLDKKKNKINISNNSNISNNNQINKLNGNDLKNEIIHSNNMKKNNKKHDIENIKKINKNFSSCCDNGINSNNNNSNSSNNNSSNSNNSNNNNKINNNDNNNHNTNNHVSNNSNYTSSTDIYEIQEFDLNILEGGRGIRLCAKLKKIAQEKDILKKVRKSTIN